MPQIVPRSVIDRDVSRSDSSACADTLLVFGLIADGRDLATVLVRIRSLAGAFG